MSQCFPKPFRSFGRKINVKVLLSNYATKMILKMITSSFEVIIFTSSFALKFCQKTEVDKLDIEKLVPHPINLSKMSNVKNDVVKETLYNKLTTKVNNIDTSGFVLKAKYNANKTELEKKFLTLLDLLKYQVIISKSLKQKVKYQVLVVQLQPLH